MARIQKPVTDPFQLIAALDARIKTLESASQLGRSTARGGTTQWADSGGTVHTQVGDVATGLGISSTGHGGFLDLQTSGGQRFKVFIQSSDPGASDPDGAIRIWFQV